MSIVDFFKPYSFDADDYFGSFFYKFTDPDFYSVFESSSARFVVQLDNASGPVKYVGFFPETKFLSWVQGFKSGTVETIVIYDVNQQIIAVFDDLHTSLGVLFYIPGVSTGLAGADVLGGDVDFLGSAGNDKFLASDGVGYYGNPGNDTLDGAGGNDTLDGDVGDDIIFGGAGNDSLYGGAGADYLLGEEGDDRLDGGADADLLVGGAGSDSILGGDGDDLISGGAGNDVLNGGAGVDHVSYADATSGVTVILSIQNVAQVIGGSAGTDTLISIEGVDGGDFDDVLTGSDADNAIYGDSGNDSLTGGLGNDSLSGGAGNDTLMGGEGNDTLDGFIGADFVDAGDGNDVVVLQHPDISDTLVGGAGEDILRFDYGATLSNSPFTFSGFEGIGFQWYRSNVSLSDTLLLQFGVDGSGRSTAEIVGATQDEDGIGGSLTIRMSAPGALDLSQVVFTNWSGTSPVGVGAGRGIVEIIGTVGADTVTGTGEIDSIDGGLGADNLSSGGGDDILQTDGVADVLDGGAGVDIAKFDWSAQTGDFAFDGNSFAIDGVDQALSLTSIERFQIFAGTGSNIITVLSGDDFIKIDGLNDTLDGGAGSDSLQIDLSGDARALALSAADLFVNGVLTGSFSNFERFVFATGSGNDTITGSSASDEIDAGDGDDVLDGGAGADLLVGGEGDDTYIVDHASDGIYDVGDGADTVQASVTFSLYSTLCETLTLTGSGAINGYGSLYADVISGNIAANALFGEGGNDTLNGGAGNDTLNGGAGVDVLIGGDGDDTFIVDTGDIITESLTGGLDTIRTSLLAYSLLGRANVENLTFAGSGNFSATGNAQANILTGGSGADLFNGDAGADTLIGGAGNDTYFVGTGDVIIEGLSGGIDTVRSGLSAWVLDANVENLVFAGTGAFSGTGNGLANSLTGGVGMDTLNGGGGLDTLLGGLGNDTYIVNAASVVVSEGINGGTDIVLSAAAKYTLGGNIENLSLIGIANNVGAGNALNNTIRGNAGNNSLYGNAGNDLIAGSGGADVLYGGAGADNLFGGVGKDAFVINTAFGAGQVDRFSDFSTADDTIWLENAIFTKFAAPGALNAAFFHVGAAAADANDYIIYNKTTGALFYDSNGNAAGGAVQVATLAANLALTNADFLIV